MAGLRVAEIHWTSPPVTGGVETHVECLSEQLRDAGTQVDLFSGTADSMAAEYRQVLDIEAGQPTTEHITALVSELSEYDVVHWHNPQWHKPAITIEVLQRLQDAPGPGTVISDIHNLADDDTQWRVLGDDRWTHTLVHSDFVRSHVAQRVPACQPAVAPLALSQTPDASPLAAWKGALVLQPTRLSRWKGSHLSLRAAGELLDEGLDFTFVHAGAVNRVWATDLDDVLERCDRWIKADRIRLISYGWRQSWSAIAQADLVLHPSADRGIRGEPFSLSAAQAVITGRALVASTSGNLPELLTSYQPKRLVSPGDYDELKTAIREMLTAGSGAAAATDTALGRALAASFSGAGKWHRALFAELASAPRAARC